MMFCTDDRILVYPVDRESLPIIKSTANYPNIRFCRLISPESWGHDGECYACAEETVTVSHDYEEGLKDCSAVWIVDSWNKLDFKLFIEPAIRLAFSKGKRIVCSKDLSVEEKALLADVELAYVECSSFKPMINRDDRVQEIRTPVIYVMSSTEYCNQFFIETSFCAELRNRGYETLLISSRKENTALGQYAIPNFMFCGEYRENEKIIALNQYIRHLEMEHQPEIIIIGIPGAAMPYHHKYSSDFGVLAYEISEAVKPDFAILSSPCMQYGNDFFKGVEESLRGRLGVYIDIHTLSPYALDFSETTFDKCLGYLSVDDFYVQAMVEQIAHDNLLNLNNMHGIASAVDRLVDKLSGGAGSLIT